MAAAKDYPLAVVIFSGLIGSTLLALALMPVFFWTFCGPVVPKQIATSEEESIYWEADLRREE